MKYKVLIVDDEEPARLLLAKHCETIQELEVAQICSSAVEAQSVLTSQHIDILLTDIKMDDLTGLELLQILDKQPATIITTAYSEYALESYDVNAIDYLLKPVTFKRFLKAITKAISQINKENPISVPDSHSDYLFVKSNNKTIRIDYQNINYIESYGEYIKIYVKERFHLVTQTMNSMEKILPKNFIRTHRSFIVNLNKIDEIYGNTIKIGSSTVPISKRQKESFLALINKKK